eukprot:4977836-Alexandrium_andersonii.AAC.1
MSITWPQGLQDSLLCRALLPLGGPHSQRCLLSICPPNPRIPCSSLRSESARAQPQDGAIAEL